MSSPLHSAVVETVLVLARGRCTADGNGTGVAKPEKMLGKAKVLIDVANVSGTTPTIDGHLEDSPDNSTDWQTVKDTAGSDVAMTQVAAATSTQNKAIDISGGRGYYRWADDVGGTSPVYDRFVAVIGQKSANVAV